MRSNPNVPDIPVPVADLGALTMTTYQLRMGVRSLAGLTSDNPNDRAVTFTDLLNLGVVTQAQLNQLK
jgi:hypothetical protein